MALIHCGADAFMCMLDRAASGQHVLRFDAVVGHRVAGDRVLSVRQASDGGVGSSHTPLR